MSDAAAPAHGKTSDSSWIAGMIFVLVASAIATQVVAGRLGFNPELGPPLHIALLRHFYAPWCVGTWAWQFGPFSGVEYQPAVTAAAHAAIWAGLKIGAIVAAPVALSSVFLVGYRPTGGRRLRNVKRAPGRLVIELGRATGALAAMGHKAGIRAGQCVRLAGNDAFQHVLVLGGTGAGKSVACLAPIMRQLFEQFAGALILNVNGVEDAVVLEIAKKAGRKVRVIGIGGERINLLDGLTPEVASAYLSSCMLLGDNGRDSKIWNTSATNLARAVLGLLYFFPKYYSLPCLYRFLFVEEFRKAIISRVARHIRSLQGALKNETDPVKMAAIKNDLRTFDTALREIAVHNELDARIRQSVEFQLTSVLSNTIAPELEDAFAAPGNRLDLESTYRERAVIVVNAAIQKYGLASAVLLAFIKCRFFSVMEARPANQKTPVAFIVDEYQDVATCAQDGRGDHNFFAKARRTRTTCILATQSLHSLVAKVNTDNARTVIANMRTRIVFRSEDDLTIEMVLKLLGKADRNRGSSSKTQQPSGTSTSTSAQTTREPIADAELFRNLKEFEAVVLASIGNRSADDVIRCTPEFIQENVA